MDFGALPPEINSLRMYSGPGSAPMLAAMTAWDQVATEMRLAATAYESVISTLVSDGWLGPASATMLAAVGPYVTWLSVTGLQAEQTATSAAAAAAAFETAYALTVPPAVVAANRTQLLILLATNFFGINTPAIAATEAEYTEMWAQDATAMYTYAGSAADAATLTPFTEPEQTTNPAGPADQAAAVAQASGSSVAQSELPQLMSALPASLQQLASPAASSPFGDFPGSSLIADLLNFLDGNDGNPYGIFLDSTLANGWVSAAFLAPGGIMPAVTGALADISAVAAGAPVEAAAPLEVAPLNAVEAGARSAVGGVSIGTDQATLVGRLSVPPSWTVAADNAERAVIVPAGTTGAAAPGAAVGMPGMPGMPVAGNTSRNWGNGPRYGFKLTIMPRPVAAG